VASALTSGVRYRPAGKRIRRFPAVLLDCFSGAAVIASQTFHDLLQAPGFIVAGDYGKPLAALVSLHAVAVFDRFAPEGARKSARRPVGFVHLFRSRTAHFMRVLRGGAGKPAMPGRACEHYVFVMCFQKPSAFCGVQGS